MSAAAPYRVLARVYRPKKLSELIGQEPMAKTLENAFRTGRIAHAFLLTGTRGAGKTTTARLIARGLNCTGPDGQGGPTTEPCGVCPSCKEILEGRSLDVLEMDAATNTSIEDVRELIDSARYAPSTSRYRVYVLDEVHMLSIKAFNALLKTLEEPPGHAKFVFATTEARKVPLTILSRCQRFELRRIPPEVLAPRLRHICEQEGIQAEEAALSLIAKAAAGSARDGISLLDQAIATADGALTLDDIQTMLGLSDRARTTALLEALLGAEVGRTLEALDELHHLGGEPALIAEDLLELLHEASRAKAGAGALAEPTLQAIAERISLGGLARAWRVLITGLDEIRGASDPKAALDMVALRLACLGDMPPPGTLARAAPAPERALQPRDGLPSPTPAREPAPSALAAVPKTRTPEPAPRPSQAGARFSELVERLAAAGEGVIAAELRQSAHLVRLGDKRLELRLTPAARADLPGRLKTALATHFGPGWALAIASDGGEPTLQAQKDARKAARLAAVARDPDFAAALAAFPGSRLIDVVEDRSTPATDAIGAPERMARGEG